MTETTLLSAADIARTIDENAKRICDEVKDLGRFAIVGIQTRGVELANRIRAKIEELSGKKIDSGILDITFYRDDLATRGVLPAIKETRIEFNISGRTILLVDDVIFTGRTTKAAIETLMSFGRPRAIRLFVLVDRGNRELPIQPDYLGYKIETDIQDRVKVRLAPIDDVGDAVMLSRR
ncbi:MAG TPA: bifunctional pyr operon transcriptional regulator/uracil phosphoribosyltransferase PyrR [Spirochaetota bacterium]|nr:bifunctional pyr operon transcriptional regulator/uracil phosphoribosyltransferase PyrR [Spirochaetota bacterium]